MEPEVPTVQVPVMEDSHNFFKVLHTKAFVDKSLLIETAVNHGGRIVITAPSKFCKSTNLHMMKSFLSDRSDQAKSEVFKRLDIYKRSKKFYKQHFHKYQVVFVDLTSGKSASYSDALDAYRWAIHNTFLEHDYLLRTSILKTSEEKKFLSWCDMNQGYKIKQKEDMANDLSLLVEVLGRYGSNNVILLVDEFDSIINKAMYEGENEKEFNDICDLTSEVFHNLLKVNKKVKLAMICGTSSFVATYIFRSLELSYFHFLANPEFFKYYGLTDEELDTILKRNYFREQSINTFMLKFSYGIYRNFQNSNVLNLFSVLKYLKSRKQISYWPIHYQAEKVIKLSCTPNIARLIHHLLLLKGVTIEIPKVINTSKFYQVNQLRLAYSQGMNNIADVSWLVFHFQEIGFLNIGYTKPEGSYNSLKLFVFLPNSELRYMLSHYFQSYLILNCNLPTQYYDTTHYNVFVTNCQQSRALQLCSIFNDAQL